MKFYLHIVDQDSGLMICRHSAPGVPDVGTEIRMGGVGHEVYYQVVKVVWCLDEQHPMGQRINVGVTDLE